MLSTRWLLAGILMLSLAGSVAYCQPGQGNGNGKGHNKHDRDDDDDDRDRGYRYNDHDRDEMRGWYRHHHDNDLPPGLAKRDRLPPGLEKQLVVRGTLPPGLRKKVERCPDDLERRLPPPPRDCRHVVISGHLVLLNTRSFQIVDVFHFER
jgi:Ni/Co efflux regulator RcnB